MDVQVNRSRRCRLVVGPPADEFDVETHPLGGNVRSLRPAVVDDEREPVVREQRDVVVDRTGVPIELVRERCDTLGRTVGRQQRSREFDPAVSEDLPRLADRADRDDGGLSLATVLNSTGDTTQNPESIAHQEIIEIWIGMHNAGSTAI